jgi:hypothetical protein
MDTPDAGSAGDENRRPQARFRLVAAGDPVQAGLVLEED